MTLQEQGPPAFCCVVLAVLVVKILLECSNVFNYFHQLRFFSNVNEEIGSTAWRKPSCENIAVTQFLLEEAGRTLLEDLLWITLLKKKTSSKKNIAYIFHSVLNTHYNVSNEKNESQTKKQKKKEGMFWNDGVSYSGLGEEYHACGEEQQASIDMWEGMKKKPLSYEKDWKH